jgi:ubiquinone biosynthesis protein
MVSNGTIYWIDFGMIGRISGSDIDLFQQLILAVVEMDLDSLVSGIMALGACSTKTKRDKLVQDVDDFIERYSSVSDISSLDTSAVLDEITQIASSNYISLPGSYTMLVRSLGTIEGVLEELCEDLQFFQYLADKLMARVKRSFDIQQELLNVGKDALSVSKKAAKIPVLASDALKSIVKGKAKINMELTGYEELVDKGVEVVRDMILAFFASVLFFGSCLLCMTDLQPKTSFGMPLLAAFGFLFSIALAIYTVKLMTKKKKK